MGSLQLARNDNVSPVVILHPCSCQGLVAFGNPLVESEQAGAFSSGSLLPALVVPHLSCHCGSARQREGLLGQGVGQRKYWAQEWAETSADSAAKSDTPSLAAEANMGVPISWVPTQ